MDTDHTMSVDMNTPVKASIQILEARNLNKNDYKAVISEDDGVITVLFIDKRAHRDVRGNPGRIPGLEVRIDPQTFQIKGSNFIK